MLQSMADAGIRLDVMEIDALSLSLPEYNQLISEYMKFQGVSSEFWTYVVKIQYLMMYIEKNPSLIYQCKNPTQIRRLIDNILGT